MDFLSTTAKAKRAPKQKIPATLKNAVWATYIGGSCHEADCYCCGLEKISRANFAAGHINAEATGGDVTLDNLRPICTLCNSSMGRANMREFILTYRLRGKFATELQNPLEIEGNAQSLLEKTSTSLDSKSETESDVLESVDRNTPEQTLMCLSLTSDPSSSESVSEAEIDLLETQIGAPPTSKSSEKRAKECPFCKVSITNVSAHQKSVRHIEAVMKSIATQLPAAEKYFELPGVSPFALFFTQYGKLLGGPQLYQDLVAVARKVI